MESPDAFSPPGLGAQTTIQIQMQKSICGET